MFLAVGFKGAIGAYQCTGKCLLLLGADEGVSCNHPMPREAVKTEKLRAA